jgi:NAD(P)-dependent dehydrogenase (short-subunit alcohol dehydrogenase family)
VVGRLAGKVAVVVGAGSSGPGWGNGKAAAVLFAREGARVVCADINKEAAEVTVSLICAEGGEALAIQVDATHQDEIKHMVEVAVGAYGGIDILDNNLGVAESGGVVDFPEEDWDRVMSVNLKSFYLSMKHTIPVMINGGGGSIINISSIAAIRWTGVPYSSYYASKAAILQLTKSTAVEFAPNMVRVNAVLPGLMKTPMVECSEGLAVAFGKGDIDAMWKEREAQVPLGHMGDAWDVAHAALFLASDEARYVTGIELVVDGGVTL